MPNNIDMPNNTDLSASSSAGNSDSHSSRWNNPFSDKGMILLLAIGLVFVLFNIVAALSTAFKPNALLFYFNMCYWPFYPAIFLWIAAIWIALEFANLAENYLKSVRISAAMCILFLIVVYALMNYFNMASFAFWFNTILIMIAIGFVARSFFLLYNYRYAGKESIDVEEATWFWSLSGIFCSFLFILGMMFIIPVRVQYHASVDIAHTMSLYRVCYVGLQDLIKQGYGPAWTYLLAFLIFVFTLVFFYIAGKWLLIVLSKIRAYFIE